jgi:hypothetical protein
MSKIEDDIDIALVVVNAGYLKNGSFENILPNDD